MHVWIYIYIYIDWRSHQREHLEGFGSLLARRPVYWTSLQSTKKNYCVNVVWKIFQFRIVKNVKFDQISCLFRQSILRLDLTDILIIFLIKRIQRVLECGEALSSCKQHNLLCVGICVGEAKIHCVRYFRENTSAIFVRMSSMKRKQRRYRWAIENIPTTKFLEIS